MTRSMTRPAKVRTDALWYLRNYEILLSSYAYLISLSNIMVLLWRTVLGFLVPWRKSHSWYYYFC